MRLLVLSCWLSIQISLVSMAPALSSTWSKVYSISQNDLKHGELQFRKMMHDRPAMAGIVQPGDTIYTWFTRQFAGQGVGYRIYWNRENPQNGAFAENHYAIGRARRGCIRLKLVDSTISNIDRERLWAAATYELFNIRNGETFKKAWNDALESRISMEEWIAICTKCEFEALGETKRFFKEVWSSTLIDKNFAKNLVDWRTSLPERYEDWIKSKDAEGYVEYWRSCFPAEIH